MLRLMAQILKTKAQILKTKSSNNTTQCSQKNNNCNLVKNSSIQIIEISVLERFKPLGVDLFQNSLLINIIIYMKKFLYSDCMRAVQFKCNTGQKSITPVPKL